MARRAAWMDQPHEFREDINDYSMCQCGIPGLSHEHVYPLDDNGRPLPEDGDSNDRP